MAKKDYQTKQEQAIWQYIQDKDIVDNELLGDIFPDLSKNKRNKILHGLYRKGYLRRVRRGLYYNSEKIGDFYKLAIIIHAGYVGLNSALRYYNLIDYEDFTIFVMTKSFQRKISLKGTNYYIHYVPLKDMFIGFEKKDDIYISSIEKTIFDCFLKPREVGYSNLTKAIYSSNIKWDKFIGFYKRIKNNALYQRTGYILELMKKNIGINLPTNVMEFLQKGVKCPVRLTPNKSKSKFNIKWKIQDNLGEKNIFSWWY